MFLLGISYRCSSLLIHMVGDGGLPLTAVLHFTSWTSKDSWAPPDIQEDKIKRFCLKKCKERIYSHHVLNLCQTHVILMLSSYFNLFCLHCFMQNLFFSFLFLFDMSRSVHAVTPDYSLLLRNLRLEITNPAYGRQSISRPMRIVAPIPQKSGPRIPKNPIKKNGKNHPKLKNI